MEKRGQIEVSFILMLTVGILVFFIATTAPSVSSDKVQLSPGDNSVGGNVIVNIAIIILFVVLIGIAIFLIFKYFIPKWRNKGPEQVSADSMDRFHLAVSNAERALDLGRIGDAEEYYAQMQEIYLSLNDRQRKEVFDKAQDLFYRLKSSGR